MDRGAWRATVHGIAKSWTRTEATQHAMIAEPFWKCFETEVHIYIEAKLMVTKWQVRAGYEWGVGD